MKSYLINPFDQTVSELKLSSAFADVQRATSDDGKSRTFVTLVDIGESDHLFLQDEGLLTAGRPVFKFAGDNVFAGRAVVLGYDKEGESCDVHHTLDAILGLVQWTNLVTTGSFNDNARTFTEGEWTVHQGPTPRLETR